MDIVPAFTTAVALAIFRAPVNSGLCKPLSTRSRTRIEERFEIEQRHVFYLIEDLKREAFLTNKDLIEVLYHGV